VKLLHERVAGIDVHKDMIKVAIRSPGEKPWTRRTEVFEFRTFYGVLQEMGRQLRHRGVTHVAMEASGVYTDPVYYALTELDFTEVIVVNPAHVKAIKDPAGLFGGTPRRFRSSGAPVVHDLLCGRLAPRVAPCLAAEWCGHVDAAAALARCSRAHGEDGAFVVPAGEPGDADPR
jgi:hypothetical protein